MSARSEILFLAHRIPYPPDKGDKIRSWRLFQHLTEKCDVHLACFIDDKRDRAHKDFLQSMCKSAAFVEINKLVCTAKSLRGFCVSRPLSLAYYQSREMREAVARMRARPLAAEIVFSSAMAQYIERPVNDRKRIVDFCDADSEKWVEYAQKADGVMKRVYAREGRLLAAAETMIANWADASFAVTPAEAILFNRRPSLKREVAWWSNGVDTEYFDPDGAYETLEAAPDVVFVGAMDYRANIEAALFFVEKVWPEIRRQAPQARFAVVGSNPVRDIQKLHGINGVVVTGRVPDVRPWLQQAKAAVAPLRVARGVQNKVLEAMAMAKPVVATRAAATGLRVTDGENIFIADDPAIAASTLAALLNDAALARRVGASARQAVVDIYDWDAQLRRFDSGFDAALRGSPGAERSSPWRASLA